MSICGIIGTWLAAIRSEPGAVSTLNDKDGGGGGGDAAGTIRVHLSLCPPDQSIICQVNLTVAVM